jgi:UDP-N-acetylglucosamine/UDP-N-acetylgalactosamine diphosphorylase
MPESNTASLQKKFEAAGQSHVFKYFDELSAEQKNNLQNQLEGIDPERINDIFKQATSSPSSDSNPTATNSSIEPLNKEFFESVDGVSAAVLKHWQSVGLKAIAEGKVAVLLLAGGQGTFTLSLIELRNSPRKCLA